VARRARRALAAVLALCLAFGALAKEAAPAAADPALEARVTALAAELRCLVCQNQSIAESNAALAVDLRNQVREQLRAGRSEQQIIDYMVERYGDFVLFRPRFTASTLALWLGPLLLLGFGLALLFRRLARRRRAGEVELSEAEHARAADLLEAGGDRKPR
jgi:cytochrome c-type biogenesis protein CcmH/NrfF